MQNLEENTSYIPYVIEPSAGVDRGLLAILNEAYTIETLDDDNTRTVLKLKPHFSQGLGHRHGCSRTQTTP